MAIELTARLVVSKKDLQAAGVDPDGTDQEISQQVAGFLQSRLPYEIGDTDQLTVGVQRKVKKDTVG